MGNPIVDKADTNWFRLSNWDAIPIPVVPIISANNFILTILKIFEIILDNDIFETAEISFLILLPFTYI